MAAFFEDKNRTVVPRWRLFSHTTALGELDLGAAVDHRDVGLRSIEEQLFAWNTKKTVWHAADLVSAAFVLDRAPAAHDAARFLVDHRAEAPQAVVGLAEMVLGYARPKDVEDVNWRDIVKKARGTLGLAPRNAVRWTDLALAHTVLGNSRSAEYAIKTALHLSPENRFILRAAVHRPISTFTVEYWLMKSV